ncbi:exo-alpha-sialidase [Mucilaginibacter sp.]
MQGCPTVGMENGHLYAVWFNNVVGKNEEPGNYITVAVSNDSGLTWNQDALIIAPDNDGNRMSDPMLWNDNYGVLHLSYMMTVGMWDGATGGDWSVRLKEVNNQVVITKPVRMFDGDMNTKPTILSDSTHILFPASNWNLNLTTINGYTVTPTPSNITGAYIYKSGYTSTKDVEVPTKITKLSTTYVRIFDEHMVVDLGNNNYTLMKRTNTDGLTTMNSSDGGLTWSKEAKFTALGNTAPSRFYFGKLTSGNLLLVMHNSTIREKLTAYLSKDNGKTWPYKVVIESRYGQSYPDVIENKGIIYLVYDYNRRTNGQIYLTKFTEQDIIDGSTANLITTTISKLQ